MPVPRSYSAPVRPRRMTSICILSAALLLSGDTYGAAQAGVTDGQLTARAFARNVMQGDKRRNTPPELRLPGTYIELYEQILSAYRDKPRMNFEDDAALSDVAFRLWQNTHDDAYRKLAVDYFDHCLSDPSFSLADFHILHHFGELIYRMNGAGLISADQHRQLVAIAKAQLKEYLNSPDDTGRPFANALFNIRIGQLAGYAGLLKFLDGQPFDQREAVTRRLNAFWDELCSLGNTDEDAENYDSLGMDFAIDLGRLLGRESDLKSPGFHRYFDNFRDIVSPSGLMPEYGDSYFSYDAVPMGRVYLLEFAARLYNDGTFLNPLNKMWIRPQAALPEEDEWVRSLALMDMGNSTQHAEPIPGPPSQILYRNTSPTAQPAADKLILRTGRQPGASMIMMDLYASGSHAAKDKGPSIAYFESSQVPLFHNMGRRGTRSAIDGNLVWAMPPGESFPGLWNSEGKWFTMSMPVDVIDENADRKHILSTMVLRNFPGSANDRGTTDLCFDNLRLQGAAGVSLVDSFDTTDGWDRRLLDTTPPVDSQDKTQGLASQCVPWNKVKTEVIKRTLPQPWPAPFTNEQFSTLKLDILYHGTRPYILVRGFGDEIELGAQVLRPTLTGASATQRGPDAMGQVSYKKYITDDATLTREIVLTAEGYLVVRDTLMPGPSMNGWTTGQLWQIYTLGEHGNGWFSSEDDGAYPNVSTDPSATTTRSMLVRYATPNGTSVLVDESKQDYTYPNPKGRKGDAFFTTYSERTVQSGHPETLSMVVVPYDPDKTAPKTLANRVAIAESADGETVAKVITGARTVVIRIGASAWSVDR